MNVLLQTCLLAVFLVCFYRQMRPRPSYDCQEQPLSVQEHTTLIIGEYYVDLVYN